MRQALLQLSAGSVGSRRNMLCAHCQQQHAVEVSGTSCRSGSVALLVAQPWLEPGTAAVCCWQQKRLPCAVDADVQELSCPSQCLVGQSLRLWQYWLRYDASVNACAGRCRFILKKNLFDKVQHFWVKGMSLITATVARQCKVQRAYCTATAAVGAWVLYSCLSGFVRVMVATFEATVVLDSAGYCTVVQHHEGTHCAANLHAACQGMVTVPVCPCTLCVHTVSYISLNMVASASVVIVTQ